MLLLAAGLNGATAYAATPEPCGGDSGFCYAGYSAKGLKTIAEDLSANGQGSQYYGQMKAAMDADTRGALKVTSTAVATKGQQVDMPVRLIGILHDDKANGSGKAGLTFQTVNSLPRTYCMNGIMLDKDSSQHCFPAGETNRGGWRDSSLRENMNSGEIWASMPADLRDTVEPVVKMTNNTIGNSKHAVTTGTNDRLWLLSYREYVQTMDDGGKGYDGAQAWSQEGRQYEFYDGKVSNSNGRNTILKTLWSDPSGADPAGGIDGVAWERSSHPDESDVFLQVDFRGNPNYTINGADKRQGVAPAFCL